MNPRVGIIMGSRSDLEVMQEAGDALDRFGIPYEIDIVSAHRTPDHMRDYARGAADRGLEVIIAGCPSPRYDRLYDHFARDRSSDPLPELDRWLGFIALHRSDAGRNTGRDHGRERSKERRDPRCPDDREPR